MSNPQQIARRHHSFVIRARQVHGDKYNYTKVIGSKVQGGTPLIIGCKKHGDFRMTPHSHLHLKRGCCDCYNDEVLLEDARIAEEKKKKKKEEKKDKIKSVISRAIKDNRLSRW